MKTTSSKLQKAGIETLTVLAVIFATCYTISAQGALFQNRTDGFGELASIESTLAAKVSLPKNEASAEMSYYAGLLEAEEEAEMTIESWMTEAAYFGVREMEAETEEVLKVEDWMINETLFQAEETVVEDKNTANFFVSDNGKTIGLIFQGAQFGRRTFIHTEMEDPELELEQWMVDSKVWVRK